MGEMIVYVVTTLYSLVIFSVVFWFWFSIQRVEQLLRRQFANTTHFYQSEAVAFLVRFYSPDRAWFFFYILRSGREASPLQRSYDPYKNDWRLRFRS